MTTTEVKIMENNTLYYTEDYIRGKLIEGNKLNYENVKSVKLTDEQCSELLRLLSSHDDSFRHRCISVYRDAIIIDGNTYNICLTCGDFYLNDDINYLGNKDEIKNFLNNIKWE